MMTSEKTNIAVPATPGVLFVGHGTRVQEGVRQFESFVSRSSAILRQNERWSSVPIDYCFLELHPKDIQSGVARLAAAGAKHLAVVPLLLFSAGHDKRDIPHELRAAMDSTRGLRASVSRPLGLDETLLDVLYSRLTETSFRFRMDSASEFSAPDASAILLVGRGGSDEAAHAEFERVASSFRRRLPGVPIFTSTMAGPGRKLEEGFEACASLGLRQIFVSPYLLFAGWLTEAIRKRAESWRRQNPNVRIEIAKPLGPDSRMSERFAEQARVLLDQIEKQHMV